MAETLGNVVWACVYLSLAAAWPWDVHAGFRWAGAVGIILVVFVDERLIHWQRRALDEYRRRATTEEASPHG